MGFLDQIKQLNELKSKMDETKKRLDTVSVTEENEWVRISVNGNRKITEVFFKQALLPGNETQLLDVLNAALAKADGLMQSEMMGALPKIPGLG
ncbi:MAG: YbaB/EbfC family nucleoid-associated protein [Chitinophagales bacterium]